MFLKQNGVKHVRSAPYHPSSNGAAERFVQTFKRAMKQNELHGVPSQKRLPAFLLSYRTAPHATTGQSLLSTVYCSSTGRFAHGWISSTPTSENMYQESN